MEKFRFQWKHATRIVIARNEAIQDTQVSATI